MSFVGYPERDFRDVNNSTQEGVALRHSYRNGYLLETTLGATGESLARVDQRYSDGAIAKLTMPLYRVDKNLDFLGRQTRTRLLPLDFYTNAGATPAQTSLYQYDELGNLKSRSQSGAQAWSEAFTYDALNRLLTVTNGSTGIAGKSFSYSDDGNLTGKQLTTAVSGSTTLLSAGLPGTLTYGTTARTNGAGEAACVGNRAA